MNQEQLKRALTERFSAPLPPHYRRRVIFWKDPDGGFADLAAEIELPGVKKIMLTETNHFLSKLTLCALDTESDFLVYDPIVYADIQDDWFLDQELANETFSADYLSVLMGEIGADQTPENRAAVLRAQAFFAGRDRREKLRRLCPNGFTTPTALETAIFCVLLGADGAALSDSVIAFLCAVHESCDPISDLKKYRMTEPWQTAVTAAYGYTFPEEDATDGLLLYLTVTALSRGIDADRLGALCRYCNPTFADAAYGLLTEFYRKRPEILFDLLSEVSGLLKLPELLRGIPCEVLADCDLLPCADERLLCDFAERIAQGIIPTDTIPATMEKRKGGMWFARFSDFWGVLFEVAQMERLLARSADAFHELTAPDVFRAYTETWYAVDGCYRRYFRLYRRCIKSGAYPAVADAFRAASDTVDGLYCNRFLREINRNWLGCMTAERERNALPWQTGFYAQKVAPSGSTVFVIISDALRYEVAAELCGELEKRTRSVPKLTALCGTFPTTTQYGMAALLPNREALVGDSGITVNGISTATTDGRDRILKKENPDSAAVTYTAFLNLKKEGRVELIRNKQVVYFYHNTIDAVGDRAATEDEVADACADAIEEICGLVAILLQLRAGATVIITADHGFLFTGPGMRESDRVGQEMLANAVESGKRYLVSDRVQENDCLTEIPMRINRADRSLHGYTPAELIRFATSGGGSHFVHGGYALEECVIPVLTVKGVRTDSKEYRARKDRYDAKEVELILLTPAGRICNSGFTLNFFQKEAVGGKKLPAEYEVYLAAPNGETVSDRQTVVADRTAEREQERVFTKQFFLHGKVFDRNVPYTLCILNKKSGTITAAATFTIDIAFAADDFGF